MIEKDEKLVEAVERFMLQIAKSDPGEWLEFCRLMHVEDPDALRRSLEAKHWN